VTGGEFIAARSTLIELLKEQQATADAAPDADAAVADDQARADHPQQQQQWQQQQQRPQRTWLQMCVAADRPMMDTLKGMWGALRPWKRLGLLWGVVEMLLFKVSNAATVCLFKQCLNPDAHWLESPALPIRYWCAANVSQLIANILCRALLQNHAETTALRIHVPDLLCLPLPVSLPLLPPHSLMKT
jgi:hypothetical protein